MTRDCVKDTFTVVNVYFDTQSTAYWCLSTLKLQLLIILQLHFVCVVMDLEAGFERVSWGVSEYQETPPPAVQTNELPDEYYNETCDPIPAYTLY